MAVIYIKKIAPFIWRFQINYLSLFHINQLKPTNYDTD